MKYQNHPMEKQLSNKQNHTPYLLCRSNGHQQCMANLYNELHSKLAGQGQLESSEELYYNKPSILLNQVHFNQSIEEPSRIEHTASKELIAEDVQKLSDSSIINSESQQSPRRDSNYHSTPSLIG